MNKKLQTISVLSFGLLLMTLAGCDWCSCCKKDSNRTKSEQDSAKTMEQPKSAEPKETSMEPKMMPEHPMQPKAITPVMHSEPTTMPVMPVMPVAPKAIPEMPEEPKVMPESALPKVP